MTQHFNRLPEEMTAQMLFDEIAKLGPAWESRWGGEDMSHKEWQRRREALWDEFRLRTKESTQMDETTPTTPKVIGIDIFDDTPCAWEYQGPVPDYVPGARSIRMGTADHLWLCPRHSYQLRRTVYLGRLSAARHYLPRFCPSKAIQRGERWKKDEPND